MVFAEIVRQIGASFVFISLRPLEHPIVREKLLSTPPCLALSPAELDLKSDPSCLLTGFQASERPFA
jgi:hypothetical protein